MYNNKCSNIAEWSSWQLVGLITQRSEVRVLPPLLSRKGRSKRTALSAFLSLSFSADRYEIPLPSRKDVGAVVLLHVSFRRTSACGGRSRHAAERRLFLRSDGGSRGLFAPVRISGMCAGLRFRYGRQLPFDFCPRFVAGRRAIFVRSSVFSVAEKMRSERIVLMSDDRKSSPARIRFRRNGRSRVGCRGT